MPTGTLSAQAGQDAQPAAAATKPPTAQLAAPLPRSATPQKPQQRAMYCDRCARSALVTSAAQLEGAFEHCKCNQACIAICSSGIVPST